MDTAFFRAAYDKDPENAKTQTWKDYEEWVRVFYEGKRFPPIAGWHEREKEIVARLDAAARERVAEPLAKVGRAIAAEWAKDNRVRKVSTGDLQAWGSQFKASARDAEGLLAALGAVEAELARRSGA